MVCFYYIQTNRWVPEFSSASVSLARAVYSRASILLLDDVLSAGEQHAVRDRFLRVL